MIEVDQDAHPATLFGGAVEGGKRAQLNSFVIAGTALKVGIEPTFAAVRI